MKNYTLITGASSGIGKAFADFCALNKENLILIARSEDKLLELKKTMEDMYKIKVLVLACDLTIPNISEKIFQELCSKNLFVEKLINCAGFGLSGTVHALDYEKQHNQIMLNTLVLFDMTKLFLDPMVKMNTGTIINVASSSAYHPIPTMAVYAATKSFVLSFTEALAIECKDTGVRVIAISPGATDTNFFSDGGGVAYGDLRSPEHVVATTMKALDHKKISKIDGANNYFTSTFMPRLLPRKKMASIVGGIMEKQAEKS